MRRILIVIILLPFLAQTAFAMEFEPPEAPESAQEYLPKSSNSFSQDLWFIIKTALSKLRPSLTQAAGTCLSLIAVTLLISLLQNTSSTVSNTAQLVGTIAVGTLILLPTNTFIELGTQTINEMTEYGKLLLPVLTSAMAAQGRVTSSAALYTGTMLFNTVLCTLIQSIAVPMLYIYLCLSVGNSALGDQRLKQLRDFIKWLLTWTLKIVLYTFTGYMGITGVVSGTMDASAVKAAKLAISGVVPVVGNILSDASESILLSAGIMKNTAGIFGILVFIAICVAPFLRIGAQYLLLKITGGICSVFGTKRMSDLITDLSGIMGLILAITGTVCLLHLISIVCFMRGVT